MKLKRTTRKWLKWPQIVDLPYTIVPPPPLPTALSLDLYRFHYTIDYLKHYPRRSPFVVELMVYR